MCKTPCKMHMSGVVVIVFIEFEIHICMQIDSNARTPEDLKYPYRIWLRNSYGWHF